MASHAFRLCSYCKLTPLLLSRRDEASLVVEPDAKGDAWAAYYAAGSSKDGCREPVYCPELGLAVEAPQGGSLDIDHLWSVV